ncbi:MAG: TrpB-like pyridoxal phosphate-dependent enzyme [Lentimicrobiaceae bacterium]|nr:TrpB-like pyridoxal phosphate-dependent enzyme [Lentimicrobiaceae bacterium]MCO5265667.1 TrpB-like pyridoxal phosphate-dependent enzyme [Lentimicrobium sp.]HPG34186.1 TrpB-like pyridoxal phosphate-dependent enzyme [Lentimicrobium sp.]
MQRKFNLTEQEIPRFYYNIVADMPNKPLPPLHPGTRQPITPDLLEPLFARELIQQEVSTERLIEIPEEVRKIYAQWRPTPLFRAVNLEKALNTPARIYYKYEGVSPAGSHKPNTAVAQAFYNKIEGIKKITTETGAGQWGTALSYACQMFDMECEVFMVKVSYDQKPYRKIMMNTFGGSVYASPSNLTEAGRGILSAHPDSSGSLGIAISEAIERAVSDPTAHYALGSVLNHVLLHQTIIGQEAMVQMEKAGQMPDIIVAPFGGGSNFAGIAFPFLKLNLTENQKIRCIAVEPESCPKLTRGEFRYDFGDTMGMTPLLPMFTLGHDFMPSPIHAGGLRYHGAGVIVSQLLKDGLIEAVSQNQQRCFEAGMQFIKTEGIIPAPEATHAIATVIDEANRCREEGISKTILFNLCGHGYFDMAAYEMFMSGKLNGESQVSDSSIRASIDSLEMLQP